MPSIPRLRNLFGTHAAANGPVSACRRATHRSVTRLRGCRRPRHRRGRARNDSRRLRGSSQASLAPHMARYAAREGELPEQRFHALDVSADMRIHLAGCPPATCWRPWQDRRWGTSRPRSLIAIRMHVDEVGGAGRGSGPNEASQQLSRVLSARSAVMTGSDDADDRCE